MYTFQNPQEVAAFIAQFAEDSNVIQELKLLGYGIVPNSFSQLVSKIESAGYKVIKEVEYNTLLNSQKVERPAELQLLGGFNPEPWKETKKELLDPFSDGVLTTIGVQSAVEQNEKEFLGNNSTEPVGNTNGSPNTTSMEQTTTTEIETTEFNHFKEPVIPEDPLKKLWFHITKQAGEIHSVAFVSLVIPATPISLENNLLKVGFLPTQTYQMKQLKRNDNMTKLKALLLEHTGNEVEVELEVIERK